MKAAEIEVGKVYNVRVSGKVCPVLVTWKGDRSTRIGRGYGQTERYRVEVRFRGRNLETNRDLQRALTCSAFRSQIIGAEKLSPREFRETNWRRALLEQDRAEHAAACGEPTTCLICHPDRALRIRVKVVAHDGRTLASKRFQHLARPRRRRARS